VDEHAQEHTADLPRYENQPAFHAYDHGANIEIQVNEYLWSLPNEISVRPVEDTSDDEESEDDL
jgi:hypothetical protein